MAGGEDVFRPEELSSEWLTQILRRAGRLAEADAVQAFEWQSFGTGQSGTSVRITLDYGGTSAGPETLVAKFASDSGEARAFANGAGMYEREVRFYNELSSRIPVRAPAAYHSALNPDDGRFVIVMEDMAEARVVDQLDGCSLEEARLVMEQAAALHAGSWGKADLRSAAWLKGTAQATAAIAEQLPGFFDAYQARYGDMFGAEAMQQGQIMVGLRFEWAKAAAEPYCLWHQDFRSDNMLFDARSGEVPLAIVDWQTIGMGRGMSDVAYFVGTSLLPEDRRKSERELLQLYHEALLSRGVADYSFDQCWLHYRQNVAQAVFTVVHAAVRAAQTERGDRMWQSWAQRTAAQAADLETFKALATV